MNRFAYVSSLLVVGAAVVLAGCDNRKREQKDNGVPQIKMNFHLDKEHTATIANQLPANLPPYAAVLPGANVVGVVTMGNVQGMPWAAVIQFEVGASTADVVAFYTKNAEAAGLEVQPAQTIGKAVTFEAKAKQGEGFISLMIAPKQDGKTFVQERYK